MHATAVVHAAAVGRDAPSGPAVAGRRRRRCRVSDRTADLTDALEALMRAIGPPPAPADQLGQALRRVDDLTGALPPSAPPQLRHFLERRSYVKALALLRGG